MGSDFFEFFFEKERINLETLISGIKRLRGYSLLCFGNFRYPYKTFRNKNKNELKEIFSKYCIDSDDKLDKYRNRPEKMLDIQKIDREDTWYLGYISHGILKNDIKKLETLYDASKDPNNTDELKKLTHEFGEKEDKIVNLQIRGAKNTDIYLSWDYIDVYVATSMRNRWEFEEVYDFIDNVFTHETLDDLNLRYFDPTQSFCANPKDKGLIEGLMLKRADCTIYLAQESDTMGKDSELASTLAQGKPVVAYVPNPNPEDYAKKIENYPLSYFRMRLFSFEANNRFNEEEVIDILTKYGDVGYYIRTFLDDLDNYRLKQPISSWQEKEDEFKRTYANFKTVCRILADVEWYQYNKRAETLREKHPLSIQVELDTGVANGVLVVRNAEDCAKLLRNILTNNMEYSIELEKRENPFGIMDSYTVLKEKISNSVFRVVTHQERLTNSFWNNFWRGSGFK